MRNGVSRGGCVWLCLLAVCGFVWMMVSFVFEADREPEGTGNEVSPLSLKLTRILRQSYVYLGRTVAIDNLSDRIAAIRNQGTQKLIVVSDFDLTLTKYWVNGKRGCTSYRVVDTSPLMPDMYRKEALSLRDTYAPIEHDQQLPIEQRAQAMEDWTVKANELLVKYKLSEETIPDLVALADVELRPGYQSFSDLLYHKHIPLLIFSAGLFHTITEILEQQGSIPDNLHIVSNRLNFREGVTVGFDKPVIHSYRKGTIPDHFSDIKNSIKDRCNVILLGDSLSDPKMADGLGRVDHMIKIGFLNHDEENLLSVYSDHYDIVLIGDPSMDIPLAILQAVLE